MLTKEELQEIKELIYRFGCREFGQDYRDQKLIDDCDRLEERIQEHIKEVFLVPEQENKKLDILDKLQGDSDCFVYETWVRKHQNPLADVSDLEEKIEFLESFLRGMKAYYEA